MSSDTEFLRSLADEIDGSELTHSWRRDRDWLREIATKLAAAEAALAACEPIKQMLLQFVKEYGEASDPAGDKAAAEKLYVAAVNHFGQI